MFQNLAQTIKKIAPKQRQIFTNIGWLLAERVLRMGVGFTVTIWVARYLGATQFGLLNYAIALISILATLAALGLDKIVVRDLVRKPESAAKIIGTGFLLKLGSGITAFLLASITIFCLRPEEKLTRVLVAIVSGSLIFDALNIADYWFQSRVQSKYTVWAKNSAFIMMTLVRIVLIKIEAPLLAFAWAFLGESALTAVGFAIAYQISGQNLRAWRANWVLAKNLLRESWPLILSNLAIMVYVRVDQVMLGQLTDDRAVGIYAAAARISEVWPFIGLAIVTSVNASLIEAKKNSEKLYYQKLQYLLNWLAAIVYAIAIPMVFFSTPLILLVFGSEYAPAGPILSVHIWSAMFGFLGLAKSFWIANEGLTVYALATSSSGAALNILLNLWLIPNYREMGAAIATVVSYGFTDYVTCFFYPPATRMGWMMTKAIGLNIFLNPGIKK